MVITNGIVGIGLIQAPVLWMASVNNITIFDFFKVMTNGFNVTTTDYVAAFATIMDFVLVFTLGTIENYTLGKDLQPLLETFSSMGSIMSACRDKEVNMKSIYRWFIS